MAFLVKFKTVVEVIQIFFITLAIVIPIRYFLFQPFFISGASMEPNFNSGEYLLVDEISYRFNDPERGDVIVFKSPNNPASYFIKRIIGLPGEALKIEKSKIIIYNLENPNGITIEEDYIDEETQGEIDISLKKDEYYVLGDNREHSSDSRSFGTVPKENIVGKAWISVYRQDGIKLLEKPQY